MDGADTPNHESYPEAAAILRDAGWKPHDGWGVYTRDTLVMGFQPDGLAFHVKNWAKVMPGHPQYSADTPDTPEEAAAWLVARFKPKPPAVNPLSLASLDEPESEARTTFVSRETIDEKPVSREDAGAEEIVTSGYMQELPIVEPAKASEWGDVWADFDEPAAVEGEDLGAELLPDYSEEPEPQAQPDQPPPQGGQDHFIGLDDLDRVKRLRIGDVAAAAAVRVAAVEAQVAEKAGEYAAIQAYVVSNLDRHTGAFTPQDEASQATYQRFLALEEGKRRIGAIDLRRREATAYLLAEERTREEIVAFDPEAGWP